MRTLFSLDLPLPLHAVHPRGREHDTAVCCCCKHIQFVPRHCCALFLATDATVYCGNLDDTVDEKLVWELFLQAGPVGQ